jgi:hypothetical protein
MSREDHPVWTVYDKLRTACLNVKYYSRRLRSLERWNFALEFLLSATAPSSAIAALFFWNTEYGQTAWKYLAIVAAITAVAKPLLNLAKRIKEYESVLSGYRTLEYDLREIRSMIEQKRKYDHPLQVEFKKALQREKALIARNPETTECGRVKRKCEDEVRRQFPPDSFFIPEEELDNDQRKRTKAETPTPATSPPDAAARAGPAEPLSAEPDAATRISNS